VDHKVYAFLQGCGPGKDLYRTTGHVDGAQLKFSADLRFVRPFDKVPVLIGEILLCNYLGGIIQRLVGIFIDENLFSSGYKLTGKIAAERFDQREHDTATFWIDGDAGKEVKKAVRLLCVLGV